MPVHSETKESYTAAVQAQLTIRSNRLINYFLISYFVVGQIFAFFYDTWLIAFGVGGACLAAYYSVKAALPHSNLNQYVLSVVLGIFMAQFIYQMHGMFEMHFFAFIGSAILITYQNWRLQIPIMLVVVIHHISFGYLQNIGFDGIYFTQLNYFDLSTFLIHFLLAAVIFFICGLWSYQLKKNTESQITQSFHMGRLQEEATLAKELAAAKEALEWEKYYLDSLMDNMPDAIYFKDKDSRFLRVSKYMANHFGVDMNDLIGKSDFDIQNNAHADEAYKDEQHIMQTGIPKIDYIEKEFKEDGSEHWVTTTKMPLVDAQGRIVGTFGMSRDITKVKMLEAQQNLAAMDKAVAQGKFEIASEVMHDIGNAVVGFGSYTTRIRRTIESSSSENLQKLVEFFTTQKPSLVATIGEAKADAVIKMLCGIALTQRSNQEEISKALAEQLNIISHIQEILNIQRQYITGHESGERKPVNMRSIINDSMSMVFASLDKNSIDISLDVPPELPIIKGDRTKLMQVLLNIIRNSIDSIDKSAEHKSIVLNAYTRPGQLILEVKDSGAGFDKQVGEQLFRRGFTTKPSGSGLGLYNCKTIIESHEGTIGISSEGPGKGAVTLISFRLSA